MKRLGLIFLLATTLGFAQAHSMPVHEELFSAVSYEKKDLMFEPISWKHFDDYLQLFSDAKTVEKFADGRIWTADEVRERVTNWIHRWENQDGFSAFAVYLQPSKTFIGHIVLGHGPYLGQAELALLFKPEALEKGYAMQAVDFILHDYAKKLIAEESLTNLGSAVCQPALLKTVHAIVRLDNPYVSRALRHAGMHPDAVEIIWGAERAHYTISTEEILGMK